MKASLGKARIGAIAILGAVALAIFALGNLAAPRAQGDVALSGNHPELTPEIAAKRTSRAAANRPLKIRVSFALRNRTELDQLLSDLQNRTSPRYRHWLTPAQFDASFGRTPGEVWAVSEWLTGEGFQVLHADAHEISCRGTVAAAENAFAVPNWG
jgi:kumamolisin